MLSISNIIFHTCSERSFTFAVRVRVRHKVVHFVFDKVCSSTDSKVRTILVLQIIVINIGGRCMEKCSNKCDDAPLCYIRDIRFALRKYGKLTRTSSVQQIVFRQCEHRHLRDYKYYCWFASDVTAVMLGVKNKSISLRWEMNPILMQI